MFFKSICPNNHVELCVYDYSKLINLRSDFKKIKLRSILRNSCFTNEPAHEIIVLITQATSEGLGEHAHPRSLTRAFAVRTHEVWK